MTGPVPGLSPGEITRKFLAIGQMLEAARGELETADDAAVRARARFERTYAEAFLKAEGAMDVRKQLAVLAAADSKLDAEIADTRVRALKVRLSVLASQTEITRSLNASLRSEWSAAA